jgi:hypothetical protein
MGESNRTISGEHTIPFCFIFLVKGDRHVTHTILMTKFTKPAYKHQA